MECTFLGRSMADSIAFATTSIIVLFLLTHSPGSNSATIKLVNHSKYTVWPAIVSRQGAISSPLAFTTGFSLQPNESIFMVVPASWSDHIWGRTLCSQDPTEKFSCVTGNCGSLTMECVGGDLNSSATVAELTMSNIGKLNSYRLNLAYGYNLPMKVQPLGEESTSCMVASFTIDLNKECPEELKVIRGGEVLACKSGCQQAFGGSTQYTCLSSNYLITFQPTKSMEPEKTTTLDNKLSKIVEGVIGAVLILLGGYAAHQARCFFSTKNCNVGFEVTSP